MEPFKYIGLVMPGKKPVIQDIAVIADATKGNPIGEAPRRGDAIPISLMMHSERADMVRSSPNVAVKIHIYPLH